jgi:hypothetical protein
MRERGSPRFAPYRPPPLCSGDFGIRAPLHESNVPKNALFYNLFEVVNDGIQLHDPEVMN